MKRQPCTCGHHVSLHRYEPDSEHKGPGPCRGVGCACQRYAPKPTRSHLRAAVRERAFQAALAAAQSK